MTCMCTLCSKFCEDFGTFFCIWVMPYLAIVTLLIGFIGLFAESLLFCFVLLFFNRYCKNPPDMEEFWPEDITRWPVSIIYCYCFLAISGYYSHLETDSCEQSNALCPKYNRCHNNGVSFIKIPAFCSIFWIFHVLKNDRITPFYNLFMEQPIYDRPSGL